MTDKQRNRTSVRRKGDPINTVDDFMARLDHPRKAEIEVVRRLILAADATIQESIKWNAPSFATVEHFATFKLRPIETVHVVFHTGAKVKPISTRVEIDDSAGLVQWVTLDRGLVMFSDMQDITSKQDAFISLVQQWITYV